MPVGLGSVLAQGLQGAVGGYQGAIDHQYDRMSKALQLQNLQYQANKSGLLNSILQGAFSGQQGAPAQASAPQTGGTGIPVLDAGGLPPGSDGSGPGVSSAPVPNMGAAPQAPQADVPAAPQPQAAPAAAPQSGGLFGSIPTQQAGLALALSPDKLVDSMLAQYSPTDFQKLLRASGIDPSSTLGKQMIQQQVAKLNNMPLQAFRGGGFAYNPATGSMQQLPQVPEGYTAVQGPNGWQIVPVAGANDAIAASAAAKAGGEGSVLPFSGVDAQGNPLPVTNRTSAATGGAFGNQPPPIPTMAGLGGPQAQGGSPVPLPGGPVPGGAPVSAGAPAAPAGRAPIYAAPPMGAPAGAQAAATNLQNELSKKWTDLSGQNTQAQTTNSYLQSIKGLASQAATGQQSDRINYVNGLLSLAGSERATDAVTANNLLDKYSNQIVARLGTGGLGTDAARSILQSAYPNAHMTPQAINEAADSLMGGNAMVQAKTRLLAPLANTRDPVAYNNAEMKFDQNADQRIFQYANIKDPTARQAFAKKLMQQDPTIVNKIRTLQQMGAF
jgi:hypothetical protein